VPLQAAQGKRRIHLSLALTHSLLLLVDIHLALTSLLHYVWMRTSECDVCAARRSLLQQQLPSLRSEIEMLWSQVTMTATQEHQLVALFLVCVRASLP
jgi:hypothetical protein